MILTASLQVDGFASEIDSETAEIRAVHDRLTSQRDAKVSNSTLGGAIGTAAGAIGSALTLVGDAAATVGDYFGAVGGGVGAFFGFLGYFQAGGSRGCFPDLSEDPEKKDKKKQCPKLGPLKDTKQCPMPDADVVCDPQSSVPARGCSPRMLYQLVFGPDCGKEAGFHSWYDDTIQGYLAQKPEHREGAANGQEEKKSRRDALLETWGGESDVRKQTELFTSNKNPYKLSIGNLEDRTNKLADLRTVVSLTNRDLSRLTEDLATGLRCPAGSRLEDRYRSFSIRTSGK
ncbi:MAG: hypothetical protein ACLPND_05475 [Candidatus Korobacteraceae bacterium]